MQNHRISALMRQGRGWKGIPGLIHVLRRLSMGLSDASLVQPAMGTILGRALPPKQLEPKSKQ